MGKSKKKREGMKVYGAEQFEERNDLRITILEFALAFDLLIANAHFKEREAFNYL